MMQRGGGVYRHGNTSPGESRDQGVGGDYTVVLEVLWSFRRAAQDNNAEGQRSKAVDYFISVFLCGCAQTCILFILL